MYLWLSAWTRNALMGKIRVGWIWILVRVFLKFKKWWWDGVCKGDINTHSLKLQFYLAIRELNNTTSNVNLPSIPTKGNTTSKTNIEPSIRIHRRWTVDEIVVHTRLQKQFEGDPTYPKVIVVGAVLLWQRYIIT
jgi:hypothetical protein